MRREKKRVNYYPFGLKHKGYNDIITSTNTALDFKYNGKEFEKDLGYNVYDYQARHYDPAIGRWLQSDPLAEEMRRHSTYNYAFNNPLRFIDPDGMKPEDWRDKNGNLIYDPKANDGKGAYTEHATSNDKRFGNALVKTETGKEQFDKLVNSKQSITIEYDSKSPVSYEKDGSLYGGVTTNKINEVSEYDMQTGKTTVVGVEIESSSIVMNLNNISEGIKLLENPDVSSPYKGLTFYELFVALAGHEIEHTTNENATTRANGGDSEAKPNEVSIQIAEEIKAQKDED